MMKNRERGVGCSGVGAEVTVERPWSGKAFLIMCFEQRAGGRARGSHAHLARSLEEEHAQCAPGSVRKALCSDQSW